VASVKAWLEEEAARYSPVPKLEFKPDRPKITNDEWRAMRKKEWTKPTILSDEPRDFGAEIKAEREAAADG
jgi:hypothetical protein